CSATDAHGNHSEKSFTVTVGLSWSGFLAPVVDGGTYKLGSTIPVKFQLTGASAGITDLDARIWVRATNADAGAKDTVATSTAAATDGNRFRWSSSDKQYIFNLSTKPLQVGTYDVIVDLGDGVRHTVRMTLR
ncbi:MAG TPA: PxKF domain-containing protein, partial [Marmoricola sp.]|nr:PxKF domain-containing protein [Marmoricola sp.]